MADVVVGKHVAGGRFGGNKRTVIMVAVGLAFIVLLLGYKMFSGGGSSSTVPVSSPVAGASPSQTGAQAVAKAVPAAAKPGPAPNTSRDPFKPLR